MLIETEKLKDQLSYNCDEMVRSIYLLLAHAKLPDDITVRPHGHGYISHELRFELNGRWYFSAVLNQSWVLWYFRRPALSDLSVKAEELIKLFPNAEITGQNEVKLRISDMVTAYAVVGWMSQRS